VEPQIAVAEATRAGPRADAKARRDVGPARLQLSYTTIQAPVDGWASSWWRTRGNCRCWRRWFSIVPTWTYVVEFQGDPVGHMKPGSGRLTGGRLSGRKLEGRVEKFLGRHRRNFFADPSTMLRAIS